MSQLVHSSSLHNPLPLSTLSPFNPSLSIEPIEHFDSPKLSLKDLMIGSMCCNMNNLWFRRKLFLGTPPNGSQILVMRLETKIKVQLDLMTLIGKQKVAKVKGYRSRSLINPNDRKLKFSKMVMTGPATSIFDEME